MNLVLFTILLNISLLKYKMKNIASQKLLHIALFPQILRRNQLLRFIIADQQIGLMLAREFQYSYRDFAQDLLSACKQNTKLGDVPIQFKDPIYGSKEPSFTDFVAPGVILT